MFTKQASNTWGFVPFDGTVNGNELVLSRKAQALYLPTDLRLNFFTSGTFGGPDYPNGLVKRLGPPTISYGVSLPDIYLLKAECKARLDDFSGARTDLESFREKRMPLANASVPSNVVTKEQWLRFIMDERTREFSVMGFRWFDMRRLSVDPLFRNDTYTHIQYSATGQDNDIISFPLTQDRFTLRLPGKIISENPGMQDNP